MATNSQYSMVGDPLRSDGNLARRVGPGWFLSGGVLLVITGIGLLVVGIDRAGAPPDTADPDKQRRTRTEGYILLGVAGACVTAAFALFVVAYRRRRG